MFSIPPKTGERKGIQNEIIMAASEMVRKKVTSGETIVDAIMPIGVSSPNSAILTGEVAACAPIDAESDDDTVGVKTMLKGICMTSLTVRMPASAPYESMKAALKASWG